MGAGLTLDDIDLDRHIVHVRHNMTNFGVLKPPKSRAGIHDVPLPQHIAELFRRWLDSYYVSNPRELVLTSITGQPIRGANWHACHWGPILKRSGVLCDEKPERLHFHATRHFCGSYWLENRLPIPLVSKLLGHASPAITMQVYAHALQSLEENRLAIDALSATLLERRSGDYGSLITLPSADTNDPAPSGAERRRTRIGHGAAVIPMRLIKGAYFAY